MSSAGTSRISRPGFVLATLALPLFTGAIFLSALLLFAVEPMFTKMVLPVLGGSPSVWSVAMVFFQTLMLAGYVYAHLLTRHLPFRVGALVHVAVLGLALLALPITLRMNGAPPSEDNPALWLIGVFGLSVGLPFFALSAHGPLLQAWFARSGHAHASDPYFLYGASNIGSFAALIAYPFLIEPFFGLAGQSHAWSAGFAILAGLIALTGLVGLNGPAADAPRAAEEAPAAIPFATKATWVGLALVPSGLLVSVTSHISTDIAAAPLMWVAPLGLYLLSFVLVFRTRPVISERASACVQAVKLSAMLTSL